MFQCFVNHVLQRYVDRTCVAYLDNILVFFKSNEEHRQHVHDIIQAMREGSCAAKIEKCQFNKTSLDFLEYVLLKDAIHTDLVKLQAVKDWEPPKNLKQPQ